MLLICTVKLYLLPPAPWGLVYWSVGGIKIKKLIFVMNCMKCSDHYSKVRLPTTTPIWLESKVQGYFFATNYMKYFTCKVKSCFNYHPIWVGCHEVEGQVPKIFLLGLY